MNSEKIIKPFNFRCLFLILLSLVFPIAAIYLFVSSFLQGNENLIFIFSAIIGLLLSIWICRSVYFLLTDVRILLEEEKIIIIQRDFAFKKFFAKSKKKYTEFKYSEIEKFGAAYADEIKKGGRDQQQNRIILLKTGKNFVPYIIPRSIENLKEFIVINDTAGKSCIIDSKFFTENQIKEMFEELQKRTSVKPQGRALKNIDSIYPYLSIGIIGLLFVGWFFVPQLLWDLEKLLVGENDFSSDSLFTILYTIGAIATVFSICLLLMSCLDRLFRRSPEQKINAARKIGLLCCIIGAVVMIIFFFLSIKL